MKRSTIFAVCLVLFSAILYCCAVSAVKRNVMSYAQESSPNLVLLDAGHGGEDGGAVSCTGAKESEINLSIALRAEQVLALCGVRTSMIRSDDRSVYTEGSTITEKKVSDLKNRVRIANLSENAVLVSIHQNHFSESQYHGAQVFYAPTEYSSELAELMQKQLCNVLDPSNKRAIKRAASVYLMEHIMCPGILIECGFLSNPQEDILLQNEIYQTKLACVIGSVLSLYLEEEIYHEV